MTMYKINLHTGTKFSQKEGKSIRPSNTMVSMNQNKIPHTNSRQILVKGNINKLQHSRLPNGVTSSVGHE